jgi:SAM-dependent methyltransferase
VTYGYDRLDDEPPPAFLDSILGDVIASFEPYRKTQRLLDVGYGAGGFLRVAKARGWTTHGVEVSGAAVEVGKKHGLGELHHGDFRTVSLEDSSFDVIIMAELIEHLPDPMSFLRRARTLLRPGGLLYMTTPHGRGLSGRVLGTSWSVLCPPEHLQLFSIASARRCVEEAGFGRSRVYTQGLLPHEIVAMLRKKLRATVRAEPVDNVRPDSGARVAGTYRLNEALTNKAVGRLFKKGANVVLGAGRLGDSLRIEAVR